MIELNFLLIQLIYRRIHMYNTPFMYNWKSATADNTPFMYNWKSATADNTPFMYNW